MKQKEQNNKDNTVKKVTLYKPVPWLLRIDVLPFAIAYLSLYKYYSSSALSVVIVTSEQQQKDVSKFLILYASLLFIHLLFALFTLWSVPFNCYVAYSRVKSIQDAYVAFIIPHHNRGSKEIVKLQFLNVDNNSNTNKKKDDENIISSLSIIGKDNSFSIPQVYFTFQQAIYCYHHLSSDGNDYERLQYPTKGKIADFQKSRGYNTSDDLNIAEAIWGQNIFDIPMPPFMKLFKENLTGPFFIFQVLCVLLWSLDEYILYSLFTLFMLVVFEITVCKQRQRSLQMLRNMRRPPYQILVFRNGSWLQDSSENLYPGDIVSVGNFSMRNNFASNSGTNDDQQVLACDMLLLEGSCIVNEAMLTGESIPQLKTILDNIDAEEEPTIDLGTGIASDISIRKHVLYGGTKIIQHTYNKSTSSSITTPPDRGCVAFVLRTGFETSQGQLMRTILFASERVTGNTAETFLFIAILLCFSISASYYVLMEGLKDETRNRFKLILHCIMIVTSVVPPELPMELSLAVTHSLAELSKSLIFCTEPFRIPFAGKVTTCCFDKTGTLTSDELILDGVVAPDEKDESEVENENCIKDVVKASSLSGRTLMVLAGCQSLVQVGGKLVGDPMERATMEGVGCMVTGQDLVTQIEKAVKKSKKAEEETVIKDNKMEPFWILHRYSFSSALKRMSVIVKSNQNKLLVLSKGAPEILMHHLADVPHYYKGTYLWHMSRGRRVLALGYKEMQETDNAKLSTRGWKREEIEKDLIFAGFLILSCPMKVDTKYVLSELQQSNHRTVMITGDGALTAADVARETGMITRSPDNTLNLEVSDGEQMGVIWKPLVCNTTDDEHISSSSIIKFDPFENKIKELNKSYDLCVSGSALASIMSFCEKSKNKNLNDNNDDKEGNNSTTVLTSEAQKILSLLCPYVAVFARISPDQKELLLSSLNMAGHTTLMCGDGTNDVGALKQAHVGISILNSPTLEKKAQKTSKRIMKAMAKSESDKNGKKKKKKKSPEDTAQKSLASLMAELQEQEMNPGMVKLGDASIASPFTVKRTSIDCVLGVVRQGRCTLVTTVQVYKILALNCLVSAYMLSTLYLYGVKQGDIQMTVVGVALSLLFLCISKAKPLEKLSSARPPSRIFCLQVCTSIIGQFIIHLISLMWTLQMCQEYIRPGDPSLAPDGPFIPNVINTAVFLLSSVLQLNNFMANYRGHPFMESLHDNKHLCRLLYGVYIFLFICASEIFPPLNDMLELAPMPSEEFKFKFIGILIGNTFFVYVIDKISIAVF